MKTTRISAGNYEVVLKNGDKWEIVKSDEFSAPYNWLVISENDRVLEPQRSKKNALDCLAFIESRLD